MRRRGTKLSLQNRSGRKSKSVVAQSLYRGKAIRQEPLIEGKPVSRWVHDILDSSEGSKLVEEMKKKYRLAI